jgi:dTDP-4-dehydrorhamnose 3,5-epimerase-like enzyme
MAHSHKSVSFSDERGDIVDIFVSRPFEHGVLIRSKKGAVRGNHYHQESLQCDLVITGRMAVFSRKSGSEEIEERVVGPNDWTEWEKGEAHEFVALDDEVVFMSFVSGVRGGDSYERDTHRLPVALHVLAGKTIDQILSAGTTAASRMPSKSGA